MSEKPAEPTTQSLREQVAADQQRRAEEFRQRFTALCEELQCDMIALPSFTGDGRVIVRFEIQPR